MWASRQTGAALITALFIVAIVTMIATAMTWHFHLWVNHAIWTARSEKMLLALEGIEEWGLAELQDTPPKASRVGPIHYKGMQLYGRLEDQQALFNVSDLLNPAWQLRFVRLVQTVDPDISQQQALAIAKQITKKITTSNHDALFLNVTQIRDIPGMTATLYRRLKPYLTAISGRVPININTASAPVLMTLSMAMTVDQANALVICVKKQGVFLSLKDYNTRCLQPLKLDGLPGMTVKSRYYIVNTWGKLGSQAMHLKRMLYLQRARNTRATVLWQTIS